MPSIAIPEEYFHEAEVRGVCGFKFRYDLDDAAYGVGVITDGTIPQLTNLKEAHRVEMALQKAIFGVPVEQKTRLHW